jgi:hypothetical protein
MRATSVWAGAVALGVMNALASVAGSAPPEAQIAKLSPYIMQARVLAAKWQRDARLYEVRVVAEADGSIVTANLASSENPEGEPITALFHSASAAKRATYLLDGLTGEWLGPIEAPMPPDEGVVVIPDPALDWSDAVSMVGDRLFGVFANGDDNYTVGVLRGTWDHTRNATRASWSIVAVGTRLNAPRKATTPLRALGKEYKGVNRATAISERTSEQGEDEFSLLAGRDGGPQTVTEMTPLGWLPQEASGPLNLEVTRGGEHWYYVSNGKPEALGFSEKSDAGLRVVIDGIASREYEQIGDVVESREGGHIIYPAKRLGQWYTVLDGEEIPVGEPLYGGELGWQTVHEVRFSEDGSHWAFVVTRPRRDAQFGWYLEDTLHVDGAAVEPAMRRGPGLNATIDQEAATFLLEGIANFQFSPDGTQWACSHEGPEGTVVMAKGAAPSQEFASIGRNSLRYTPDGALLWVEVGEENSTLWRDGASVAQVPGEASLLEISPDGKRVALSCQTDEGEAIHVVGGSEPVVFGPFELVEGFTFSPDSKHCAAGPWNDEETTLLVDGKVARKAERISESWFTTDGRHVYGVKETGKQAVVVVGDKETPTEFDEIEWIELTSTEGAAYVGLKNGAEPGKRAALVIDGKTIDVAAEFFKVAFFPDGAGAVYEATRTPNGTAVMCFKGVDQPKAPLLSKVGEKLYVGGNSPVVDGQDLAHYISLYEDGRVALARVHPRTDRPAGR